MRDTQETEIPIDHLQHGNIVIVKPGERTPVPKPVSSKTAAGTILKNDLLQVETAGLDLETMLSQAIKLVEEAQSEKVPTPYQRWFGRGVRRIDERDL